MLKQNSFRNKKVLVVLLLTLVGTVAIFLVFILFFGTPTHQQLNRQAEEFGGGVVAIDVGWNHSAAITADGGLWVWGSNSNGQVGDGGGSRAQQHRPVRIMDDVVCVSAGAHQLRPIRHRND